MLDRISGPAGGVRAQGRTHHHVAWGGGQGPAALIEAIFLDAFRNPLLEPLEDSARLQIGGSTVALTTDSFVVSPLFFPGGNIGDLAVNGTVNDLAVAGATPLYLTAGFILEEGFPRRRPDPNTYRVHAGRGGRRGGAGGHRGHEGGGEGEGRRLLHQRRGGRRHRAWREPRRGPGPPGDSVSVSRGLPCRVAGRLLFSLKQRITFCLFGSVSGRLLGRRALGVGCCLRCKLGLLRSVALFA